MKGKRWRKLGRDEDDSKANATTMPITKLIDRKSLEHFRREGEPNVSSSWIGQSGGVGCGRQGALESPAEWCPKKGGHRDCPDGAEPQRTHPRHIQGTCVNDQHTHTTLPF